ncbi:MAG TPA: hypothetical protein VEO56_02365, partial [Bacteroidota bacterium]|nr:hypothetical protein [Bacteroidota bacterium]
GSNAAFAEIFERLKALFSPVAPRLVVSSNSATSYFLDTPLKRKDGRSVGFGGVRIGKAYVSYHLMSVYVLPEQRRRISPALRKRMQGKSCFNFTEVDESLFAELGELTVAGAEKFLDRKFLESMGVRFP